MYYQIKCNNGTEIRFAEVQFYFMTEEENGDLVAHALVSMYGHPNHDLLEESYHTLHAFPQPGPESSLQVIEITSIISVVSVQPLPKLTVDEDDRLFVIEKSGMDDTELTGYVDVLEYQNGD